MATKYRKKPVVIEAVQWDGTAEGATPIINWVLINEGTARWNSIRWLDTSMKADGPVVSHRRSSPVPAHIAIDTLEGVMRASAGDWIIRGVQGEFYPCKPDIFAATYEPVES